MSDKVYNLSNDLLNLKSKLVELDGEVKESKNKISYLKDDLEMISSDETSSKVSNILLLLVEILAFLMCYSYISSVTNVELFYTYIIAQITVIFGVIKTFSIALFSTKEIRELKKKNINLNIEYLEENINILIDKINKQKELVKEKEKELLKALYEEKLDAMTKKELVTKQDYNLHPYEYSKYESNDTESKVQMKLKL